MTEVNEDLQLMTTVEVAGLLGLKVKTLECWRWQGQGPAFIKVGRHARYRKSDLQAWLDKRQKRGGSD